MKYSVEVKETLFRLVEVEAESMNEAKEITEKLYKNEEIVLTADDFKGVNFSVQYR